MGLIRGVLLILLVGCQRQPPPPSSDGPFARLQARGAEMISQAKLLLASERHDQISWILEIGMDDLLETALNRYESPPFHELGELLKTLDSPYSPVRLTGWLPVSGCRDYIVGYSITLAPWQGSARLRAAHWDNGRYTMIPADKEAVHKAEEELAYWRGADLYARYGPPYHPGEIHMADCWGPDDLASESTGHGPFMFRAGSRYSD